ncbi:MAG: carbon storage regulator [Planctomycetaceae bacterium]|nr:carbon storage regulator [Planctomycetaceae bacterium]
MLILSRQNRESVVIEGADGLHRLLKVTVLEINGANVKLGFEVDPDARIHCAEVPQRSRRLLRERRVADNALI